MAVDMFLKLEKIDGESEDAAFGKWVQITSFTFGVSQVGSASTGGGVGSGKAEWSEMTFVKAVDSATPILIKNCAAGIHIPTGTIKVRRAGAGDKAYYTITMHDLIVSGIENSGGLTDDALLEETVKCQYSKIEFEYKAQDKTGALGSPIKSGYDLKANKAS